MKLRLHACQINVVWEDAQANHNHIWSLLEKTKPASQSLVVLPELFAVGFSMNTAAVAEPEGGPTYDFLRRLGRRWECAVLAGVPRKQGRRTFNEAVCLDARGRLIERYAKTHLFNPGGEGRHYTPGSTVRLFKFKGVTIAPFVCYDLRFPELFRAASLRGAECMVVIANWPAKRDSHWRTLLQARAIENQAFVLGVNRIGSDPNMAYCGNSSLFGPKGDLIAQAGDREQVLTAELDVRVCRQWRVEFSALRDRRTGLRTVTSQSSGS